MPTRRSPRPPPHDRAGGQWRLLPSPAATAAAAAPLPFTAALWGRRWRTHSWRPPPPPYLLAWRRTSHGHSHSSFGFLRALSHILLLQLARSFVRYLPIKRRRSLAPSTARETLTHARTHTRRISERPHAHAARRTTIVLFMFAVLYSDPPLVRGPSTSSPRRRCNKHKVHRRHHRRRRRNMVLIRGPITDALGSVYNIREERIFAAECYYFRRKIVLSSRRLRLLRRRNNNIIILWCIRSQRQCQHHLVFRMCFNSDEMCVIFMVYREKHWHKYKTFGFAYYLVVSKSIAVYLDMLCSGFFKRSSSLTNANSRELQTRVPIV